MSQQTQIDQQFQSILRMLAQLNIRMLLMNQRVAAAEARERLHDLGKKPAFPVEFRAQFGEDAMIWDLLGGQTEGFFIEVGAFDGYHFSVTYGLEAVGWKGLLIEAIPERAEECRKRRPQSRVVNAGLSRRGSSGTTTLTVTEDQYGGMLSYLHADEFHLKEVGVGQAPKRQVTVPLTTMDALLEGHTGPIDVAVIDVAGGEVPLLEGFDLHRWKPRILMLNDSSRGRAPALANYMKTQPYTQIAWLEMNRVYIRADETAMLQRLRRF